MSWSLRIVARRLEAPGFRAGVDQRRDAARNEAIVGVDEHQPLAAGELEGPVAGVRDALVVRQCEHDDARQRRPRSRSRNRWSFQVREEKISCSSEPRRSISVREAWICELYRSLAA